MQVDQLRDHYDIKPGEIDFAGFPLFALFNGAMGVTTIIPDMDPTRPAEVNPINILEAIDDWNVTQALAHPPCGTPLESTANGTARKWAHCAECSRQAPRFRHM